VQTAATRATAPIRVLLVGEREEDFFLVREILERNRRVLDVTLEHAPHRGGIDQVHVPPHEFRERVFIARGQELLQQVSIGHSARF